MNCPYCDESVHLLAKFCPKCGLPLKEDAGLAGGAGRAGIQRWVVAAGAAAIVLLALGIGLLSTRGGTSDAGQTVRRETVVRGSGSSGAAPVAAPASAGFVPSLSPGYRVPAPGVGGTVPSSTPNVRARWAYTPPAGAELPPVILPEFRPDPPRHLLTMNPDRPRRRAVAHIAPPDRPEIPDMPPGPILVAQGPSPALEQTSSRDPEDSDWLWDPVHERWALRSDWKEHRKERARARRRTRPSTSVPRATGPSLRSGDENQGQGSGEPNGGS